jgi:membrane protein implicated in regulation of membrane protease activity
MGVLRKIGLLIIGVGLMALGTSLMVFGITVGNGELEIDTTGWIGMLIALIAFIVLLIAVLLRSDRRVVSQPSQTDQNQSSQPLRPAPPNVKRHCNSCGREIPADAILCPYCGTKVIR